MEKFTCLSSSISSTERDINMQLGKLWTAINKLLIIWKSGLSDEIKCNFFQAAVVSVLQYGCTTCTLRKHIKKKPDEICTRMLQAIVIKSWKRHPTKQELYSHLPPISKTIQIRWTRHEGHCWRNKDKLISDINGSLRTDVSVLTDQQENTYIQQLCLDTECSLEDLLEVMDDRDN